MTHSMRLSKEGLDFITKHETVVYKIYDDGLGILTGGIGHVIKPGETNGGGIPWQIGDKLQFCQVESWLRDDMEEAEGAVNQYVVTQLSQKGFNALVSFVFNVGVNAFKNSTLLRLLNLGQIEDAAEQFQRWKFGTKNGKKVVLGGLVKRRAEEKELFLQGELVEFP
jgi:lysozyme